MARWIPEVRALYDRVRRPAKMVVMGLALVAPAGGMMLRGGAAETSGAAPAVAQASMASFGTRVAEAKTSDGGIAAAWRARALERERALEAERDGPADRLAREYGISVALARQIHGAAVAEGIEPRVAFGLVRTESSFRRTAVSSVGAVGYTQLLPSTARWMVPGTSRSDLFHPQTNLRIGFRYLNYLQDKYNGNLRLALTAYNRGPGTVDRLLRRGVNPENGYADKVLRRVG